MKHRLPGDRDENWQEHPSFGMVSIHRTEGGNPKLFGSGVKSYSKITLKITRAAREHDLSHDRYYAREQLIEVDMSPEQFAQLITTLNHGSGTPCTLRYIGRDRVPEYDDKVECERIQDTFKKELAELNQRAKEIESKVATVLEKKSLNKEDRKIILSELSAIRSQITSSIPFIAEMFHEASEKMVTQAKAEVDAFVNNQIVQKGLQSLMGQAPNSAMIESKKDEDDGK